MSRVVFIVRQHEGATGAVYRAACIDAEQLNQRGHEADVICTRTGMEPAFLAAMAGRVTLKTAHEWVSRNGDVEVLNRVWHHYSGRMMNPVRLRGKVIGFMSGVEYIRLP